MGSLSRRQLLGFLSYGYRLDLEFPLIYLDLNNPFGKLPRTALDCQLVFRPGSLELGTHALLPFTPSPGTRLPRGAMKTATSLFKDFKTVTEIPLLNVQKQPWKEVGRM